LAVSTNPCAVLDMWLSRFCIMPSRNGSPVTAFNAEVPPAAGTAGFGVVGGRSLALALKST